MPITLGRDGRIDALDAVLADAGQLCIGLLETLPATYKSDTLLDLVTGNEFTMGVAAGGFYTGRLVFGWTGASEIDGYADARVSTPTPGGWLNDTGGNVTVEGMFVTDSLKTYALSGDDANGKVVGVGPVSGAPLVIPDGEYLLVEDLSITLRLVG